jgi:histo-blood group ABO system transferase
MVKKKVMHKLYIGLYVLSSFLLVMVLQKHDAVPSHTKLRIGLCVMATGVYIQYIPRLLDSADRYFLPNHEVTYFVFTDSSFEHAHTTTIYQEQLGWPYDSMMRFHTYLKHADQFADLDYVYAIDADMGFAAHVGDEILSDRVATILSVHLFKAQKPYEANPLSTAYVHVNEGREYYAGAFYGGSRDEFVRLVKKTSEQVDIDLARGYIAWANDESHINRYFVDNRPTLELSPSYCHFEHWQSPFPKKIIAYDDKDYTQTRKASALNPIGWYVHMLRDACSCKPSIRHSCRQFK